VIRNHTARKKELLHTRPDLLISGKGIRRYREYIFLLTSWRGRRSQNIKHSGKASLRR
jgi:hypothetical protein